MNIPQEFDTIRPWEPEDLPEVFDRLLSNDQFKSSSCLSNSSLLTRYVSFKGNYNFKDNKGTYSFTLSKAAN